MLWISVAVHGVAFSVALGFGAYAVQESALPPARIEVARSVASAPERPVVEVPDVLIEDVVTEPPLSDVQVAEPFAPDSLVRERRVSQVPVPIRVEPTLERVRRPVVDAAAEPVAKPELPEVLPPEPRPAVPSPAVDAEPLSDNEPPRYPDSERRRGREGEVVVAVQVDSAGVVQGVSLRRPSRYAAFNREALRAVRQWRFRPAIEGDVAVASETDVTVTFCLTD